RVLPSTFTTSPLNCSVVTVARPGTCVFTSGIFTGGVCAADVAIKSAVAAGVLRAIRILRAVTMVSLSWTDAWMNRWTHRSVSDDARSSTQFESESKTHATKKAREATEIWPDLAIN